MLLSNIDRLIFIIVCYLLIQRRDKQSMYIYMQY